MKRTLLLFFICVNLFASLDVYGQMWEWAKGARTRESEAYFGATDLYGNVYAAGNLWTGINIDTAYIASLGYSRAFLIQFDSSGHMKWHREASGGITLPCGITTDGNANAYFLGTYDSVVQFGTHTLTSAPSHFFHYFLVKFDMMGNVKWLKGLGNEIGAGNDQGTNNITTDLNGSIYILGTFTNNPTIGGFSLTNAATDSTTDILLTKLDSSGNVIWAKSYGGKRFDVPSAIVVTKSKNIYIDGTYNSDTLSFGVNQLIDTGAAYPHYYTGMFLAKLDSSGNPIWARGSGGGGLGDYFSGIASNSDEDVFVTGSYTGSAITLDTQILPKPPAGSYGFLGKYDSSGNILWAKLMQGQHVMPWSVTVDRCDNLWIVSNMGSGNIQTSDTIDGHILAPIPGNDNPNFIAGWTKSGTFIDAIALPTGSTDDPNAISADNYGNLYVVADNETLATMILGHDTLTNTSSNENMFIAKYNPNFCNPILDVPVNNTSQTSILLYPNPANNECTIRYDGNIILGTTMIIYDMAGRLVLSCPLANNITTIPLTELNPGVYQCRIIAEGKDMVTKKLVVMR